MERHVSDAYNAVEVYTSNTDIGTIEIIRLKKIA
jgi:hypothetical protein